MQGFGGSLAKEYFGGFNGREVIGFGVDADGDILRQRLLQHPQMGSCLMLGNHRINFLFSVKGENPDVFFGIGIGGVEPELVKPVR